MLLGRDINGGFADYVTAPADHVFRLPDGVEQPHRAVDPGADDLFAFAAG